MGSWSVSCGISNIAITSGQQCVLLPIKKARNNEYLKYLPATLPIFGDYDDYGGIESIEDNENTKLIEEHFGITIAEFCQFLIDGRFTYNREEAQEVEEKLKEKSVLDECKDWRFMWMDRQVYDFMTSSVPISYGGAGDFDMGNKDLLEFLGFEYIGENTNNPTYEPKRYKYEWKYKRKKFYSDGTWIHQGKDSIYRFSELTKIVNLPEDKLWIGEKTQTQLWRIFKKTSKEMFYILGKDRNSFDFDFSVELVEQLKSKFLKEDDDMNMAAFYDEKIAEKKLSSILDKYVKNVEIFGDGVAELCTLRNNLHPMSGQFLPHTLYLTPQCGEYKRHQKILEKFSEINKTYCQDEEDEDSE